MGTFQITIMEHLQTSFLEVFSVLTEQTFPARLSVCGKCKLGEALARRLKSKIEIRLSAFYTLTGDRAFLPAIVSGPESAH